MQRDRAVLHNREQTNYLRCSEELTGHPAHLHDFQTFQPLQSSSLIMISLVKWNFPIIMIIITIITFSQTGKPIESKLKINRKMVCDLPINEKQQHAVVPAASPKRFKVWTPEPNMLNLIWTVFCTVPEKPSLSLSYPQVCRDYRFCFLFLFF